MQPPARPAASSPANRPELRRHAHACRCSAGRRSSYRHAPRASRESCVKVRATGQTARPAAAPSGSAPGSEEGRPPDANRLAGAFDEARPPPALRRPGLVVVADSPRSGCGADDGRAVRVRAIRTHQRRERLPVLQRAGGFRRRRGAAMPPRVLQFPAWSRGARARALRRRAPAHASTCSASPTRRQLPALEHAARGRLGVGPLPGRSCAPSRASHVVSISDGAAVQSPAPTRAGSAPMRHGLPIEYPFTRRSPSDYFLRSVGRMSPEKRPDGRVPRSSRAARSPPAARREGGPRRPRVLRHRRCGPRPCDRTRHRVRQRARRPGEHRRDRQPSTRRAAVSDPRPEPFGLGMIRGVGLQDARADTRTLPDAGGRRGWRGSASC